MLSLCMIVKNELKYIEQCLTAVKPYVDEIVVADTGSTDGTIEVLERMGCKVYHFEWCDDYAKARNFAISKSTNDWILVLDADEIIVDFNKEAVDRLIKTNKGEIYCAITAKSFLNHEGAFKLDDIPRLFNKKFFSYERAIHEVPSPKFNFKPNYLKIDITVHHFGYLVEATLKKSENYLRLLEKTIEEKYDPYLVKHVVSTKYNLGRYEEAIIDADKILNDKSLEEYEMYKDTVIAKLKCFINSNRFDEALKMEQYYNICQNRDDFLFNMATAYLANDNQQTALDIYLYLVNKKDLSISKIDVIVEIGKLYLNNENYAEALKWLELIKNKQGIDKIINACNTLLNAKQ